MEPLHRGRAAGTGTQHCVSSACASRGKEGNSPGRTRGGPSSGAFPPVCACPSPAHVALSPAPCPGREAAASSLPAWSGVSGQPSAEKTTRPSDSPRRTNERLQTRLVRLERLSWLCVCVGFVRVFAHELRLRSDGFPQSCSSSGPLLIALSLWLSRVDQGGVEAVLTWTLLSLFLSLLEGCVGGDSLPLCTPGDPVHPLHPSG